MSKRRDTLYMETTEVPPTRTAGEIIALLVRVGANEINQSYAGGKLTGIKWAFTIGGQSKLFELPVRTQAIFRILQERRASNFDRVKYGLKDEIQAERIAWRQLLRWTELQVAMIQTGMAEAAEVFLPYWCIPGSTRTLYQELSARHFQALPLPSPEVKQ